MSSDLASNMRATAEALVMAFDGKWETEAALAPRADNCVHIMLPASLGIPRKNNAEWAARFEHIKDLILDAKMTVDDYVGAPEERRAVCRSTLQARTPVGPYRNEYIWFFTFDESGTKIISITEFLDSQATTEIRSKLAEARLGAGQV